MVVSMLSNREDGASEYEMPHKEKDIVKLGKKKILLQLNYFS